MACRVGHDSFGSFVKEQAAGAGVEISWVVEGPEQTTTSVVCINSEGERSFLYYPGSTSALTRQDLPDPLPEDCGIVFVAGAMLMDAFDGEPCAALLRQAQGQGKYTGDGHRWDFQGVWLPKVAPSLPQAGPVHAQPGGGPAAQRLREEPADIADFFLERGVKNVIIKLGSKGAYFCPAGGERFTLPACQGVKAVDTTGRGTPSAPGSCAAWPGVGLPALRPAGQRGGGPVRYGDGRLYRAAALGRGPGISQTTRRVVLGIEKICV